jgi:hypothetical protein
MDAGDIDEISDRGALEGLPAAHYHAADCDPHIRAMNLELSAEETAALTQELHDIVEDDPYPLLAPP